MEQIPGQQDHIDISFFREAHDFMKGFPAIVTTNMVTLIKPDMIIGRHEDANSIRG